jgi:hypothetical protein
MKRVLTGFVVAMISTLAPGLAQAELSASLIEIMARPIGSLAMSISPAGATVIERAAGREILLRTRTPDVLRTQLQEIVSGLDRSPEAAEELYLRLSRLEYRFQAESKSNSTMARGSSKFNEEDIDLIQRLAREELSMRGPTFMERMTGSARDLESRLEFAPSSDSKGTFSAQRERFLAGEGAKGSSALDRSIKTLRELAHEREMTDLLLKTPEGHQILDLVYGAGTRYWQGAEPLQSFVDKLAADPSRSDLAIQLAMRLTRASEVYAEAQAKHGFGDKSHLRQQVLTRIASKMLALADTGEAGAIAFAPMNRFE